MAEMSREEVLTRYRHLRAISTRHHTEAMNFISRPALLEQARHLGLDPMSLSRIGVARL